MGVVAAGSEGAPPIVFEAERIEGTLATGLAGDGDALGVRIVAGDIVVTAERAQWRGGRWVLEDGAWTGPQGTVRFGRAEWVIAEGAGTAGSRLPTEFRSVAFDDLALTPCTCDDGQPGNLRFRAARATLELDAGTGDARAVQLLDAIVDVRQVPLLFVRRARVPLTEEGLRWDLPELGHGASGWRVAVPVQWTRPPALEGAKASVIRLAPRWREVRGFGLTVAQEGPHGEVRADGGWDTVLGRPRGVLDARGHVATDEAQAAGAPTTLAWDLDVASDADWAGDMGTGWSSRAVPWRESRARLAAGVFEANAWLPDDGSGGPLLRVEAGRERRSTPQAGETWRWAFRPGVEAGLDGSDVDAGGVLPRALGSLSLRGDVTADLWSADLELGTQAGRWGHADGDAAAGGRARVAVPLWVDGSTVGAAPFVLEPGVDARGLGDVTGAAGVGSIGPALRGSFVGERVSLDLDARLGWAGALDPAGRGALSVGPSRLEVRGDAAGDTLNLAWRGESGGVAVEAARLLDPRDLGRNWMREPVLAAATGGWVPPTAGPRTWVAGASVHAAPVQRLRIEAAAMRVGPNENIKAMTTVVSAGMVYDDGCTRFGVRGSGALDGTGVDLALELRLR